LLFVCDEKIIMHLQLNIFIIKTLNHNIQATFA
jgi:hypothetical protein